MTNDGVIKDINIQKRINDGVSVMTINFNTPQSPNEFQVGMPFEFIIDTGMGGDDLIVFRGIIETVSRDEQNQNRIYAITGRDEGRLLSRQPFQFDCETLAKRKYSYIDILNMILEDTNLRLGRELPKISGSV